MTLTQLHYAIVLSEASSMSDAARKLYISQPSLSASIRDLENEIGIQLFDRTPRGIRITPEGEEFISYARQVKDQFDLLTSRYTKRKTSKKKFSVSMQHYSFAVEAFIRLARKYDMDDYELAVRETKTHEVIDDVQALRSEVGVIYINDFNKKVMRNVLAEHGLTFSPLFDTGISVYMSDDHPLAENSMISIEELQPYPCLSFSQGRENSFYYAEEVLSTYNYRQTIKATDRATMLDLMRGLHGYTLCSGIASHEFSGNGYVLIPLDTNETMTIGYIQRKGDQLSELGENYVTLLREYHGYAEGKK